VQMVQSRKDRLSARAARPGAALHEGAGQPTLSASR
jgi:hypothetical protein